MKKLVAFCMMVMALGFVTVGCGGSGTTPAPATPAATDTATPAATDAAPADAAPADPAAAQ